MFTDEEIDTMVTLPTLEAALFMVEPLLSAKPPEAEGV